MNILVYCCLFVLLTFISLPTTADAFSRRSHHSQATANQASTAPLQAATTDTSPNAVPEPPVLMLMTIGFGLFALGSAVRAFRKRA